MASDVAVVYPSTPNEFIRITDDESFIEISWSGTLHDSLSWVIASHLTLSNATWNGPIHATGKA
jgi:hypothetical protein